MSSIVNFHFSLSQCNVKHADLYPNPQIVFSDSVDTRLIQKMECPIKFRPASSTKIVTTVSKVTVTEDGFVFGCSEVTYCWRIVKWTVCLFAVRLCTAGVLWAELCFWLQWGYVLLADCELNCVSVCSEVMYCWRTVNWTLLWHSSCKLKRKLIFHRDYNGKIHIKLPNIIIGLSVALFPCVRYPSFYKIILYSIYPSIHPSVLHPSIHQPINLFNHPPIYHNIHPSMHSPSKSSTHPTIHPSTKPSIHPSIHQNIYPTIHPSINLSIPILLFTLWHEMFNLSQTYLALFSYQLPVAWSTLSHFMIRCKHYC